MNSQTSKPVRGQLCPQRAKHFRGLAWHESLIGLECQKFSDKFKTHLIREFRPRIGTCRQRQNPSHWITEHPFQRNLQRCNQRTCLQKLHLGDGMNVLHRSRWLLRLFQDASFCWFNKTTYRCEVGLVACETRTTHKIFLLPCSCTKKGRVL